MPLRRLYSYSQHNFATGRVVTDESRCTGCGHCVRICPGSALMLNQHKRSVMRPDRECISCGACTAVCLTTAITIDRFFSDHVDA